MYGASEAERGYNDLEDTFHPFNEKTVRLGFIRKVYGIVCLQLLVTFGITLIFSYNDNANLYVKQNGWLFYTALAFAFGSMIALACCQIHRSFPTNFIVLGVFTIAESILVGTVSAMVSSGKDTRFTVLTAVGITALIVVALTLFACQTKYDFTASITLAFVTLLIFSIFGLFSLFFRGNMIVQLIYACIGALIFSWYLVIDTQMILGGGHKYQFSPEDYIFAAINIYVDIINIFLYILNILALISGNSR